MDMSQVIVAIITLLGVVITGVLAIVNTRISKKMEKVEVQKVSNDQLELQNNIIEQLLPVFEKKDFALDRIADILEQLLKRQEMVELTTKNFAALLEQRCEAPILLKEIRTIQQKYDSNEARKQMVEELITGEEVRLGTPADEKNDT